MVTEKFSSVNPTKIYQKQQLHQLIITQPHYTPQKKFNTLKRVRKKYGPYLRLKIGYCGPQHSDLLHLANTSGGIEQKEKKNIRNIQSKDEILTKKNLKMKQKLTGNFHWTYPEQKQGYIIFIYQLLINKFLLYSTKNLKDDVKFLSKENKLHTQSIKN